MAILFKVNAETFLQEAKLWEEYAKSLGNLANQMVEIVATGNKEVPFSRFGNMEFGTSIYRLRKETASLKESLQEPVNDLFEISRLYSSAESPSSVTYAESILSSVDIL